ncbi:MAG: thioredoxin [Erysipelotrichaceae bacterium]|nr:thioredoxin [Erysipelotrichaceae bacterium]
MKIVNDKEFKEVIKEGITLVDFYADWCGPCKALAPVLEALSEEYTEVNFIKVNVDESEETSMEYGIMSIPAVFMLKDGNIIGKTGGYRDLEAMKSFIDDTLKKI